MPEDRLDLKSFRGQTKAEKLGARGAQAGNHRTALGECG